MTIARSRIICHLEFGDILKQLFVWFVLSVITFGIASLFFPYYMMRLILNHSEIQPIQGVQS